MRMISALLLGAVAAAAMTLPAEAETSSRPAYGCFKVTAPQLNIRGTAFSTGDVVATAIRGETLIKRRSFCTARGFWCAVTTTKGIQGYADKSMMTVAPCPARTSVKVN